MPEQEQPVKVSLNPGLRPTESPVDFQAMSAKQFREVFEDRYTETVAYTGANEYVLQGAFVARDRNPSLGNHIITRLTLTQDGDSMHVDLTALACIQMAEDLITFGIAQSNVNGEAPHIIGIALVALLGKFLHPRQFATFTDALAKASEEQRDGPAQLDRISGFLSGRPAG